MRDIQKFTDMPDIPAVYALYGGTLAQRYVAYVGIGGSLRQRVEQHLVRRDSSVATGVSAVHLNPEHVVAVCWWEHASFDQRDFLEAAASIAVDILDPALRSRGNVTSRAKSLYVDTDFATQMRELFDGEPTGQLVVPSLSTALQNIAALDQRVDMLEKQLSSLLALLTQRGVTKGGESIV